MGNEPQKPVILVGCGHDGCLVSHKEKASAYKWRWRHLIGKTTRLFNEEGVMLPTENHRPHFSVLRSYLEKLLKSFAL